LHSQDDVWNFKEKDDSIVTVFFSSSTESYTSDRAHTTISRFAALWVYFFRTCEWMTAGLGCFLLLEFIGVL